MENLYAEKAISFHPHFSATTPHDLKIFLQNSKYKDFTPSEQLYLEDYRGKIGISAILDYEFNAKTQK